MLNVLLFIFTSLRAKAHMTSFFLFDLSVKLISWIKGSSTSLIISCMLCARMHINYYIIIINMYIIIIILIIFDYLFLKNAG